VKPVLFHLFGITFHSYAVTIVTAFVVATIIGAYLAYKDGRHPLDIVEGATVIVIGAVLGSKVFHTLFEAQGHELPDGRRAEGLLDLLREDPWHWARLTDPGYVFYGGVVFAVIFGVIFIKRRGIDRLGAVFDYAAPGFALGIAIGRTGCFLAGCCHGRPTDLPIAVSFPLPHPSDGVPVHPVQLYDVTFGLIAFVLLLVLYKRRRFEGEAFAALVTSYAVWRFISEMFRGDGDRGVWLGGLFSTSQLVSLTVAPIAIFLWWRELKKTREKAATAPDA